MFLLNEILLVFASNIGDSDRIPYILEWKLTYNVWNCTVIGLRGDLCTRGKFRGYYGAVIYWTNKLRYKSPAIWDSRYRYRRGV